MSRFRHRKYSRGAWAVERERHHISDYAPPQPDALMSMHDIVDDVVKGTQLNSDHWAAKLQEQWQDLMGSQIAEHTRPGALSGNALIVFVQSSAWLHELERYSKPKMEALLRDHFGADKIRYIRFRLDPHTYSGNKGVQND